MIRKGPSLAHCFRLTELSPDLTSFLNFHSQGALQHQSEDKVIEIKLDNKSYIMILVFLISNFNWQPLELER
jgi:hypothetical protein